MKWQWYFTPRQIGEIVDATNPDPDFLWGASTAGFQVEGGFNGPEQPKNNWYDFEATGRAERTGDCCRFWERFEQDFDACQQVGLNAFRLGFEWARVQPSVSTRYLASPPDFDPAAFDGYARMVAALRKRSMRPVVTLYHWVTPRWLGLDVLLDRGLVEEHFREYVRQTVTEVNRRVINEHGQAPMDFYITVNEPLAPSAVPYLLGQFPRGIRKGGPHHFRTAFENCLLMHCVAYEEIHAVHREQGWPEPAVTFNPWASVVYETDKLTTDILLAREAGVDDPARLPAFLEEQRRDFESMVRQVPQHRSLRGVRERIEQAAGWWFRRTLGDPPLRDLVERVYSSASPRWLDVLSFDWYDPFIGDLVDFGLPTGIVPRDKPWMWRSAPESITAWLKAYASPTPGKPIYIVENGMCFRGMQDGSCEPRSEGTVRIEAFKATVLEALKSRLQGVNLQGYFYWSLLDNYEWGTYEPRFGMFHVDYANDARRSPRDVSGTNMAGAYRDLIQAWNAGDKAALKEAFTSHNHPEEIRL